MGRPSDFTQEIADVICEGIADGRSLRSICDDEGMPSKAAVCRWLGKNDAFRDQYAHAREMQADTYFEDVIDIADDSRNDWMKQFGDEDIGWRLNGDHVRRAQLRIDARKWMAGKLRPKKYGDKLALTDPTGEGPLQVVIQRFAAE